MIEANPVIFTRLAPMSNTSSLYSGLVANKVITMPTTHTNAVFVTFKSDLVRASKSLVTATPEKLKKAIVMMPEMVNTIRIVSAATYLIKTRGSSKKP